MIPDCYVYMMHRGYEGYKIVAGMNILMQDERRGHWGNGQIPTFPKHFTTDPPSRRSKAISTIGRATEQNIKNLTRLLIEVHGEFRDAEQDQHEAIRKESEIKQEILRKEKQFISAASLRTLYALLIQEREAVVMKVGGLWDKLNEIKRKLEAVVTEARKYETYQGLLAESAAAFRDAGIQVDRVKKGNIP